MANLADFHLTEKDMLRQLNERKIDFAPFELSSVQLGAFDSASRSQADALICLNWEEKRLSFAVEIKNRFDSLQIVRDAIEQVRRQAKSTGYHPMICLPYLSKKTITMLKDTKASGFDLCGNLFVCIPGDVYIERIGKPNQFPSSAPIKNVYQKNSSLVSRLLLLQPSFESITAIVREIKRRNGNLTQATVSKVCQRLEDDIIITKRGTQKQKKTRLIQPDTLLEYLSEQYAPPIVKQRLMVKARSSQKNVLERFIHWSRATGENIVQTGAVSCTAYTVMAREEIASFYCSHVARLLSDSGDILEETERFADIELLETDDQFVYLDQRDNLCSSPIQSYLELRQGDKRDRQAAEMIAQNLLKKIRIALNTNGE